jgi:hypothetical protein
MIPKIKERSRWRYFPNGKRPMNTRPCLLLCLMFLPHFAMSQSGTGAPADSFLSRKLVSGYEGFVTAVHNYHYDSAGRLIEEIITDANGDQVLRWKYDAENRMITHLYQSPGDNNFSSETRYFYKGKRLVQEVREGKRNSQIEFTQKKNFAYDDRGDVAAVISEGRGEYFRYRHDRAGRLVWKQRTVQAVSEPARIESFEYEYDNQGRLARETLMCLEGAFTSRYYYDADNRLRHKVSTELEMGRGEHFEYADLLPVKVDEHNPPPAFTTVNVAGVANEANIRVRTEPNLTAPVIDHLAAGAPVTVTAVSTAVDQAGDRRAPWYRIETRKGVTGWAFGYFIDAPLVNRIWQPLTGLVDWSRSFRPGADVFFNRGTAALYDSPAASLAAGGAPLGEQAVFLRFDEGLSQTGSHYVCFAQVRLRGRDWWVRREDLSHVQARVKEGVLTTDERTVFSEIRGTSQPHAENDLVCVDRQGNRQFIMPLNRVLGNDCHFFNIRNLSSHDVNGDGIDEVVIIGAEGSGRLETAWGQETFERWTRWDGKSLRTIFTIKKDSADEAGDYSYRYEFLKNKQGLIYKIIVRSEMLAGGSLSSGITTYEWNGSTYVAK